MKFVKIFKIYTSFNFSNRIVCSLVNNLKLKINNNTQFFFKYYLKKLLAKGLKLKFFNFFFKAFFIIIFQLNKISVTNNINNLFNNLTKHFTFFFFFYFWKLKKAKTKRKKLKQKLLPKFGLKDYYLNQKKRSKIIYKIFSLKLKNLENKTLTQKIIKLCLDTFLNLKLSWFYHFKINFFSYYLKL